MRMCRKHLLANMRAQKYVAGILTLCFKKSGLSLLKWSVTDDLLISVAVSIASLDMLFKVIVITILYLGSLVHLSSCQESRYENQYQNLYFGPYSHIYPPADITQDPASCTPSDSVTCPLFISAFFGLGTGGSFSAKEVVPAVQLALDQMNDDPSFLQGYRLHYLLGDANVRWSWVCNLCYSYRYQSPLSSVEAS